MSWDSRSLGLFTLTPPQSKRLIAEAAAVHPAIVNALQKGTIVIGRGTTNSYIAARFLGNDFDEEKFAAGIIRNGELEVVPKDERLPAVVLKRGSVVDEDPQKAIEEFNKDDVLIKGGNAIDPDGVVGVLLGSRVGGTIGKSLGIITARGAKLIMPIGLEKLIPSVHEAVEYMGIDRINYSTGEKAGLMPVVGADVITEIEAIRMLTGVEATMVAAGGWGDSQGSVVLSITGEQEQVENTIQWVEFIKGRRQSQPKSTRFP